MEMPGAVRAELGLPGNGCHAIAAVALQPPLFTRTHFSSQGNVLVPESPGRQRLRGALQQDGSALWDGWDMLVGRGGKGREGGSEQEVELPPAPHDGGLAAGTTSTVPLSCPSRDLPRYRTPSHRGTWPSATALQQVQFSKHNVAWKMFIIHCVVVVQPFQVDAQAEVCCSVAVCCSAAVSSLLLDLTD